MTKTKTKTHVLRSDEIHDFHRQFDGTIFEFNSGPFYTTLPGSVIYGDNYTDWARRLAHHQQATTNLTVDTAEGVTARLNAKTVYTKIPNMGASNSLYQSWSRRGYWPLYAPGFSATLDTTMADNMAKTRFLKDVRATRNQFRGGVFLGELREAIHMIRHPAQSLLRGMDSYLHAASRRVKKAIARVPVSNRLRIATGVLGDTWLEYSFGWIPFINDIKSAQEALARRAEDFLGTPVKGVGVASAQSSFSSIEDLGSVAYSTLDYRVEEYIVIYRGYVAATLDKVSRGRSLLGFSAEQFLPTIWELLPWSFLSDYFVNIDDLIECSSTSTNGLSWVSRTTVRKLTCRKTYVNNPKWWFDHHQPLVAVVTPSWSAPSATSTLVRKQVSRGQFVGSLVPTLRFNTSLRDLQLANIAALVASKTFSLQRELRGLLHL